MRSRLFIRTFYLACVWIFCVVKQALPQNQPVTKFPIDATLPPSPNAAGLGIYGQIPVSLFSGLPEISIPFLDMPVDEAGVK